MFGRFFAFEMGCQEDDTYLNEGEIDPAATMICECRGLGCNKCKKKKARVITLTGRPAPMPIMNIQATRLPMAPWSLDMIMMNKRTF